MRRNDLTVKIVNHGCKLNQFEGEALGGLFEKSGFRLVDGKKSPGARVTIINTCTVTGKSDALLEASFSVVDENGRQVNGLYSMGDLMRMFSGGGFDSKQQRVGPLAPGKYKVTAFGPDGSKTTKPVILNGQPERKLTLKLDD